MSAKKEKNSLLANALSSAVGGLAHATFEQPLTTPVEATITQMQINGTELMSCGYFCYCNKVLPPPKISAQISSVLIGRGFFSNFKSLLNIGVFKGLYRAFPTAMVGAAPKVIIRILVCGREVAFHFCHFYTLSF